MNVISFRLKPKTIFGIILAITGIAVLFISFASKNLPDSKSAAAVVSASTDEERRAFLESYGWELSAECEERELTIPEKWNDVYSSYNEVQLNQGFDLSEYKGKRVTLYTYNVTNYEDESVGIVADMLVCDGRLIGGDICNTSAKDGFLVGFNGE